MNEKYIYIDFEGFKSLDELRSTLEKRIAELNNQNFDSVQILKIVFEDSHFKKCFISNQLWRQLKDEFTNSIKYENTLKNSNNKHDHSV